MFVNNKKPYFRREFVLFANFCVYLENKCRNVGGMVKLNNYVALQGSNFIGFRLDC